MSNRPRASMPKVAYSRVVVPILLFAVLALLFLHRLSLLPGMIFGGDAVGGLYPTYLYFYHHEPKFPLWNPYIYGGTPVIAQIGPGLYYPTRLLYLFLPMVLSMKIQILFHFAVAFAGMYLYLRVLKGNTYGSLIAAVVFTFNGRTLLETMYQGHLNIFIGIAWLPIILLFLEKALQQNSYFYGLLAGSVLGIQLLGTHPQIAFYGILALGLYFVFRLVSAPDDGSSILGRLPILAIILITSFSLFAIQFFSTFELSTLARTNIGEGYLAITRGSLLPENLILLIFPEFWGSPLDNSYFTRYTISASLPIMTSYVGIFPLILASLAVASRRDRHTVFFTVLALLSVALALGEYSPIFKLFYHVVPGFNMFRIPARILMLFNFATAVLAGLGADVLANLERSEGNLARWWRVVIVGCGLIFLFILSLNVLIYLAGEGVLPPVSKFLVDKVLLRLPGRTLSTEYYYQRVSEFLRAPLRNASLANPRTQLPILFLFLSVLAINLRKTGRLKNLGLKVIVVSLIVADLWSFGGKYYSALDPKVYYELDQLTSFLLEKRDSEEPFRILPLAGWPSNKGMIYGVESTNGYASFRLTRYWDFVAAFNHPPPDARWIHFKTYKSRLIDLLNVKYILTSEDIDDPQFALVYPGDERIPRPMGNGVEWTSQSINVYENRAVMPRAFFVNKIKVIKDPRPILKELEQISEHYIILEEDPQVELPDPGAETDYDVEFLERSPDKLTLNVQNTASGFLFLSEIYYPGWNAYVDGARTRIYRANYTFRAVFLEEGDHIVQFIFQPSSVKIGRYISLITVVMVFLTLARHWGRSLLSCWRRRQSESNGDP